MGQTSSPKSFPNQLTPFNQSGGDGAVSQVKPVPTISTSDQGPVGPSINAIIPPAIPEAQQGTPASAPNTPALGDSTADNMRQLRANRSQPFFGQMY